MLDSLKSKFKELLNGAGRQKFKDWAKTNQQKIALVIGYVLVAALFFNIGRFINSTTPPEISIEEPALSSEVYDNLNKLQTQITTGEAPAVAGESTENCAGKIKGNIGSSGKIYHLPGGAFYNRTNPEMCFDTEAAALEAGFRKSQR